MSKHSNVHNNTHIEPSFSLNALALIIRREVHERPRRFMRVTSNYARWGIYGIRGLVMSVVMYIAVFNK